MHFQLTGVFRLNRDSLFLHGIGKEQTTKAIGDAIKEREGQSPKNQYQEVK